MIHSWVRRSLLSLALLLSTGALLAPAAKAQGRTSPEQQQAQFEKRFEALVMAVSLTDEQQPLVRSILEKEQMRRRELMQSMRQGQGSGGGREGMRARMQELDTETSTALDVVLSDEQMEKYAAFVDNSRQQAGQGNRRGGRANPQDQN